MIRALAAILLLCLIASCGLRPAFAYDPATQGDRLKDITEWFGTLRRKAGARCCSLNDGQGVDDDNWDTDGKGYHVRINGARIDSPGTAVVPGPNKDGRPWVWRALDRGNVIIRCFLSGTGG
jgi:hypothetical protein